MMDYKYYEAAVALADKSLQQLAKGEQRIGKATNETISSLENQCCTQTSKKNGKQQHGHKVKNHVSHMTCNYTTAEMKSGRKI
ncbi:hypothetical protein CDAR_245851 [Caerostris darwini]|uniref:Uncharacterized protein n=1 Tax=Caerostris darwini TaxID=1538125 RepID=A0AAV4VQY8_9ARAC|nr:hypothetical protein CDAR_245851 [Caerostris darwini]